MATVKPAERAVIFDLDGTLIDSREDIAAAANAARVALGLSPLPLTTIVSYVGEGADRLIERLTPDGDADQRVAALAAFTAHYAKHCCDHTQPYPGIAQVLAALSVAGWRLGVATNKPTAFAQQILDRLGLARWLPVVVGGDQAKKPDPAPLRAVLDQLGAQAVASWMVGDHHTDIYAGRAAGCRVLWCAWGIGDRQALPVDAQAASPAALLTVLEG